MPFPRRGLFHITGEHDTGKTAFALTCGVPINRILFLDHDIKTQSIVQELGENSFGMYMNLNRLRSQHPGEVDFATSVINIMKEAKSDTFDCLVFDNFTPFEDTMFPYGLTFKDKYVQTWSTMGVMISAQKWGVSWAMTEILFDEWMTKFKCVFIISHLKDHNINGRKTGKQVPAVKRVLPSKATMRVWLRHNEMGGGKPVGLMLKRPGKYNLVPGPEGVSGVLTLDNFLPRRMPQCTWEKIDWYYENPFGEGDQLTPEARAPFIPNDFELSILNEVLTKDQQHSYELALQYGKPAEEELFGDITELDPDVKSKILEMKGNKPPAIIAKELEIALDVVKAVLAE